jgi:predicted ATPase
LAHTLEPVLNELHRSEVGKEISLDLEGERSFIDELLDAEPNHLDTKFRDTLFVLTQAYPFFTIEFLRSMQEHGELIRDSTGYWVAGENVNWEVLPPRVQVRFAEQVRRLPIDLLKILTIACLEGDVFTAEVLAFVLHKDLLEILQVLSYELDRIRLLVQVEKVITIEGQTISTYRFRHTLFRRYLYKSQNPAERNYLVKMVKEAVELIYGVKAHPEFTYP